MDSSEHGHHLRLYTVGLGPSSKEYPYPACQDLDYISCKAEKQTRKEQRADGDEALLMEDLPSEPMALGSTPSNA